MARRGGAFAVAILAIYVLLRDDGRGFGEPSALSEGEHHHPID